MNSKYYLAQFTYLIIVPIVGGVTGYVFYVVYLFLGNDVSMFHLKLFVVVWFLFGLFSGIYAGRERT